MIKPLVDVSTFVGVQSLYWGSPKARDPWAWKMAGQLADLYVYSKELRYILPMPSYMDPDEYPGKTDLLKELGAGEPGLLLPVVFETDTLPYLNKNHILSTFEAFLVWARANRKNLRYWSALHKMEWVREGVSLRVSRNHVFDPDFLKKTYGSKLVDLARELCWGDVDLLLYTYDVVLRYPLYGGLVGQNSYYLNHPIRNAIHMPGSHYVPAPLPPLCISFEKTVGKMAKGLTMQEYVKLLQDLRKVVQTAGLHRLAPGGVDQEHVRSIAQEVKLTPYLKDVAKRSAVVGGLIGGLGAITVLGPASAILGGSIAVIAQIWDGQLPAAVAGAKWLRWLLRWEIEDQIEEPW